MTYFHIHLQREEGGHCGQKTHQNGGSERAGPGRGPGSQGFGKRGAGGGNYYAGNYYLFILADIDCVYFN